jgi:hypothetical protein
MSSAVPHDQQSIEQANRDRRHDEQIHRRDAVGMVMKKRLPALRRWFSSLPQDTDVLRALVGHNRVQVGDLGQFPCDGFYAVVAAAGTVRIGDRVVLN